MPSTGSGRIDWERLERDLPAVTASRLPPALYADYAGQIAS